MAWAMAQERIDGGRACKARARRDGAPVSYAEVVARWQDDETLQEPLSAFLVGMPFDAFFWEMPPITRRTWDRPFECVVVDSPALARVRPDQAAFAKHFVMAPPGALTVTFANLGGDAMLVAPAPLGPAAAYAHLAAFLRSGSVEQIVALWRAVGAAVDRHLTDDRPLWLSTSGLGVGWLHVRLDSDPKYYTHDPYRRA